MCKKQPRVATEEETLRVAKQILEKHIKAFKSLAKGISNEKN